MSEPRGPQTDYDPKSKVPAPQHVPPISGELWLPLRKWVQVAGVWVRVRPVIHRRLLRDALNTSLQSPSRVMCPLPCPVRFAGTRNKARLPTVQIPQPRSIKTFYLKHIISAATL